MGEDSLPSSVSVMDISGKQSAIGFYCGIVAKNVNKIHDVRTKSNLVTWGIGFDLTFIKSDGKVTKRTLRKTVVLVFKIIVKNWNGDRREWLK